MKKIKKGLACLLVLSMLAGLLSMSFGASAAYDRADGFYVDGVQNTWTQLVKVVPGESKSITIQVHHEGEFLLFDGTRFRLEMEQFEGGPVLTQRPVSGPVDFYTFDISAPTKAMAAGHYYYFFWAYDGDNIVKKMTLILSVSKDTIPIAERTQHLVKLDCEHAKLTVSSNFGDTHKLYPDTRFHFTITPDEGYYLLKDTIRLNGAYPTYDYQLVKDNYDYDMPNEDLVITAEIVPESERPIHTIAVRNADHVQFTFEKTNVKAGEEVVFTAVSDPGYNSLNGSDISTNGGKIITSLIKSQTFKFTMPNENVVIDAYAKVAHYPILYYGCESDQFQLNIGIDPNDPNYYPVTTCPRSEHFGGTITLDVVDEVAAMGEQVTITLTPPANAPERSYIDCWVEAYMRPPADRIPTTEISPNVFTFEMPPKRVWINARYREAPSVSIQYDGTGGSLTSSAEWMRPGDPVTLTTVPEAGYQLKPGSLLVNNGAVAVTDHLDGTYTFAMPKEDVQVTASFEKASYSVTTEKTDHGTITANTESASLGDTITLTAAPETGYQLKSGSLLVNGGDVPVSAGENGSFTFMMPGEDVQVTASFEKASYSVAIESTDHGTITANQESASLGDTITLTATPETGYQLKSGSLLVNDGDVPVTTGENGSFTFAMPAQNVSVSAAFEKVNYAVSIPSDSTGGSVTVDRQTAQHGDFVTLTVTPSEGFRLSENGLRVNDGAIPVTDHGDGTYTFRMPIGNVEVTASFEKLPDGPTTNGSGEKPTQTTPNQPDGTNKTPPADTGDTALGTCGVLTLCAAGAYVLTRRKRLR